MPGFANTMKEFAKGKLHSGSKKGPIVRNPQQAKAIAVNQKQKAQDGDSQMPASLRALSGD